MGYLSFVTFLWAFSFSLIGVYLAGQVDTWFSVVIRIGLASLVFIPFLRLKHLTLPTILKLMAIGAIQLGVMYCFYYQSFLYLSVPEVLLFTVFTPIYVTIVHDLFQKSFSPWYLLTAAIAVLGAVIIQFTIVNPNFLIGFLIIQGANICFAVGQVSYKQIIDQIDKNIPQHHIFGLFYLGALCVTLPAFLLLGDTSKLPTTTTQWEVLVYLGVIASGLGYFMWNKGATRVNAGALAIMNNLVIPLGIIVNLVIWNRNADLLPLGLGALVILLSLWINQSWVQKKTATNKKTKTAAA